MEGYLKGAVFETTPPGPSFSSKTPCFPPLTGYSGNRSTFCCKTQTHTIARLAAFDRLKEALQGKTILWSPQICQNMQVRCRKSVPILTAERLQISANLPQLRKSGGFDDQGIPWCSLARWQALRGVLTCLANKAPGNFPEIEGPGRRI